MCCASFVGDDIFAVTVCGQSAPILQQTTASVVVIMPAATTAGACEVVIQSLALGNLATLNAYTYNPRTSLLCDVLTSLYNRM